MTVVKNFSLRVVPIIFLVIFATAANAATVWTGPWVEFSKVGTDDPAQAANQDRITPLVWLTRGSQAGLYNAAGEDNFQRFMNVSPVGTEWAFQGLNGNPETGVSAENFGSLNFTDWTSALGIQQVGRNIVERPGVVHLIEEDIYFDILFLEWTSPSLTAMTYRRTSPIPIPAAGWLMATALGLLGFVKRRRLSS